MGGKSGGGASTPHEAPNTLNSAQSLRIIDAICEGEIRGFANGNDKPWKSVYFDDTPVQNPDGSFNFKGVVGFFQRGTPDQTYIPGFDASERAVPVSVEVKNRAQVVRSVSDELISRLRITVGVERNYRVEDNGDTNPAQTTLLVKLLGKDGVAATKLVSFTEKSSGVYYQDVVFDSLPPVPFNIQVSRPTPDSTTDKVINKTYFASYVEIIDAKLSYPHTALAALAMDSDQFGSNNPRRNYLIDGMLVNVPSNYNPETRTYSGTVWDGSFKKAWTNNPAWVFYDVLTQPRYSTLARRLKSTDIDKWTLYQVGKYCDELVDDGFGGKEPRFVCNAYITNRRQAGEFLLDLASVFRGLPVWDGSRFSLVMDADSDPVAMYNNSNVKDGLFAYSGVPYKSITTAVIVQYVDKYDGYRTKTEYVEDQQAIKRYGLNIKQITAFGCDSRGQAARYGAWMLETELRQQSAIKFTVGREGLRHLPYDVVQIMDNDYAGAEVSGRLVSVSGLSVTLDRDVDDAVGKQLSVETAAGIKSLKVMAQPEKNRLELAEVVDVTAGGVWILMGRVKPRLYRVIGTKENADDGTFEVSGILHDPKKYTSVDNRARFDAEVTTLHGIEPKLTLPELRSDGDKLLISWENLTADGSVLSYDIKIYRDNKLYRHVPDSRTAEISLENLPNGSYRAEIRGRNARGVLSEPLVKAWSLDYTITGLKAAPRLQAIQLDWTLPQTVVNDVQTEIWYAESNNRDAAKKLTTLPYPQNSYTLSGVAVSDRYWFWLRLVDAAGNSGEWTAAVAGRSDPNPAPIVAQLRGAIEKSSLSQALIDSLNADAASKVAAEAQARVAAIQAASKKAADDLAAKARELGTKITVVENVNTEQARQIQAVTAAQGNTAAGLEAEKRARAEGDRAEAQARETLVGRVASAEGSINTLRETVVRNDGARAEEIRQLQAKFTIPDTRNDNRPPSWYYSNHPRSTVSEFKQANVLGLGSGFTALETVVPWGDPSGGRIFQTAYLQDGTVMRRKSDTAHTYAGGGVYNYTKDLWTEWAADETADGAQAKADAVRRVAEAAQAAANRVEADFRQFASTQAGKDGATAQRISELSASIGNLQIGGRNFIRDSAITVQNANYLIQTYTLSDNMLQEGEPVVVTIWGDLGSDREAFWPFNSNGWNWLGVMKKVSDGVYRIVTTWKRSKNNPSNDRLLIYCGPNSGRTASRIDRIKLERGTVGTDWSPAPEDEAAHREAALTRYQNVQAQKDAALSEEQKTLKAELSGQKARVEQSAIALATLDGKVRAMYGLKVETMSGGRKVIAGLALGADGQTGDSQMLVYADKFAIVDPKSKILKSPFVVQTAGGKTQMALSGDFVADGLIHGRHIAAGQTLSSPSIEGGSLNIGGGKFTVSSDGSLVAQNAVVRGRIEGESGYFNGTIKASRIEGDVMKVVRMKKLSNTVWEVSIQAEALPMMVRPDFEVRTVSPDHARRNQATAEFLVDGKRQPVSRSFETRVTSVIRNEKFNTIDVKTDYTATTSYGWYVLPRNKSVLLRLQLAENETPTTPIPCLQTAYLSPSDAEYKTLIGKMVWRRLTDYVRLKVSWLDKGIWKAVYGLPDDIYGLRLKYLTDNNPEWANGIVWMQDGTATAIKANSKANHAAAPRQYTREVNQASSSNAVILSAHNDWQWMELRDVEVLVPEDRVF